MSLKADKADLVEYSDADLIQEIFSYQEWLNIAMRQLVRKQYRIELNSREVREMGYKNSFPILNIGIYKEVNRA